MKADYSDEARRANIEGEIELEIVVRRDGTVGDVKVLRGLRGGLAGTLDIDLTSEPIGIGSDGEPVMLAEIWPSAAR